MNNGSTILLCITILVVHTQCLIRAHCSIVTVHCGMLLKVTRPYPLMYSARNSTATTTTTQYLLGFLIVNQFFFIKSLKIMSFHGIISHLGLLYLFVSTVVIARQETCDKNSDSCDDGISRELIDCDKSRNMIVSMKTIEDGWPDQDIPDHMIFVESSGRNHLLPRQTCSIESAVQNANLSR
jgi:hypothetical protein